MKQFIAAMLLCALCIAAGAQNIKKMEYFFDTDPGAGKAKPLTITATDTVNIAADITITNLAKGQHALYIRSKTDSGWGHTESVLFTVYDSAIASSAAKEEYFFDNDPGVRKATAITIASADTLTLEQALPTGDLAEGLHTLYLRVGNNAGYYSHTESALFYVTAFAANTASITGAEYFIDTDPGAGKGKKLVTGALTDTLKKTYNITAPAGLDAGINHYVCIRVKDEKGIWSLYGLDTFRVSTSGGFAALKINAEKAGSSTAIQWTSENSDAVSYTVEKSIDGIDFAQLDKVQSKAALKTYNTKDMTPATGVNFYRIKQVNATGDISYSNIAKVLFDASNDRGITVYPNPAKDIVNIRFNAAGKTAFVNIFDASGRWIKMHTVAAGANMQINVSDLARGTYVLQVSNGEKTGTTKMVKQ